MVISIVGSDRGDRAVWGWSEGLDAGASGPCRNPQTAGAGLCLYA